VNAGGDLRVFGNHDQPIYIRNPSSPSELINIGLLNNAALATSSLYFAYRDKRLSHIINPLISIDEQMHVNASDSFSILANECVYADALTKVLALSQNEYHPCFKRFSAIAIRIPT
jgi:thiamine biosynthesis lipoprotein